MIRLIALYKLLTHSIKKNRKKIMVLKDMGQRVCNIWGHMQVLNN